ncbi:DedA family protein [Leuconostoc koreense]|nr:DedA family protein [Leuconostoc mesenteroides]QGM25450.1 DedA family protein [Leuconostoc mesenteroides subsp. mesenteroides]
MLINTLAMMPEWITYLISSDADFSISTFVVMFLLIFVETAGILTGFIPGDAILITAGGLVGTHHDFFELGLVVLVFAFASFLGDGVNYWFGAYITKQFGKIPIIKKYVHDELIEQIAGNFHPKRWLLFIVLGRFLPFIRVAVPLLAHRLGLAFSNYLRMSAFASFLWSLIMVSIGYFIGHLAIPRQDTISLMIVIAIVLIVILRIPKCRQSIIQLFIRK